MAVPKLRFKDKNGADYSEWERKRLKNIASRITRKNSTNETDLPLTISSIDGLVDQRTYFKKQVASKDMSGYYLLYNGEFAYNKSYSVGYDFGSIKRLDKYDKGALSTLYICFSLNDTCNSDFVKHFFDSSKWNSQVYKNCAEGARNHGLLNISADDFMSMEINIPSVEEQQKIAYFLTTFDKRITAQLNIVANMEEIKKGLLQKIFSQKIRFKNENGKDYPEWENKKLSKYCQYIKSGKNTNDNGIYDLYGSTGIIGKTSQDSYKGTFVLIARVGANAGLLQLIDGNFGVTDNTLVVSVNGDESVEFMYYYLLHHNLNRYIFGSGQPLITGNILKNIDYKRPCLEEQKKIASFLSIYDKKIEAEKKILADLQEMKKGLLQQLFV